MNSERDDDFIDRLKTAAKRAGGMDELARLAGIPRRTLGNYVAGRTEPKRPQLVEIARVADLSLEWLVSGKGIPLTDESFARLTPKGPYHIPDGFMLIPRYDVRAGAGSAQFVHDEEVAEFLAFREDWVRQAIGVPPEHLCLITATGDSMLPTIGDGDLLLLDRSSTVARDDAIYAIRVGDELLVKRIQRRATGALRIVSDNPAYEPEDLGPEDARDLSIVGRVVWHCGVIAPGGRAISRVQKPPPNSSSGRRAV